MAKPVDILKGVLGGIAPVLGTALGGPLGGVAGGLIAKALGVDSSKGLDPASLAATIQQNTDPDLILKLKQADNEFQEFLKTNNLDVEQAELADRASARNLAGILKSAFPYWAGFLLIALCLFAEFYVLIHGLPSGLDPIVTGRILGTLDALALMAAGFIWGSSGGSQSKDEALASIAKGK